VVDHRKAGGGRGGKGMRGRKGKWEMDVKRKKCNKIQTVQPTAKKWSPFSHSPTSPPDWSSKW